jgi:flavin reductase (DIM6/NTAB) family NADH-FMN oxidoreductase RutF
MEAPRMPEPVPPGSPDRVTRTHDDIVAEATHELPYGIYVIGSNDQGRPNGMIADWVMQVSFHPRLIAVGMQPHASTLANVRATGHFTVNLLKQEGNGMALAAQFVQPHRAAKVRGRSEEAAAGEVDKLAGIDFELTEQGCPILEDALAWLRCEVEAEHVVGDHVLVIGRVVDGEVIGTGEPLTSTFTGWVYSG